MGLDNPLHIAFLVVILLLIFGARRLPEIGRSLGSGMREFKDSVSGDSKPVLPQAQAQQAPAQAAPVQAAAQPVAPAQPAAAPAAPAPPAPDATASAAPSE